MSYAVRKDGQGWRAVDSEADCGPGETYSEIQPDIVVDVKSQATAEIKAQITAIESGQHRALREAAIGIPGALDRLKEIDKAIADLRSKIK